MFKNGHASRQNYHSATHCCRFGIVFNKTNCSQSVSWNVMINDLRSIFKKCAFPNAFVWCFFYVFFFFSSFSKFAFHLLFFSQLLAPQWCFLSWKLSIFQRLCAIFTHHVHSVGTNNFDWVADGRHVWVEKDQFSQNGI